MRQRRARPRLGGRSLPTWCAPAALRAPPQRPHSRRAGRVAALPGSDCVELFTLFDLFDLCGRLERFERFERLVSTSLKERDYEDPFVYLVY